MLRSYLHLKSANIPDGKNADFRQMIKPKIQARMQLCNYEGLIIHREATNPANSQPATILKLTPNA